jgi:hypothetical protein
VVMKTLFIGPEKLLVAVSTGAVTWETVDQWFHIRTVEYNQNYAQ